MKRTLLGLAAGLVVSLAISRGVEAQGASGLHFGLAGGVDVPVKDQEDAYERGWHGSAFLTVSLPVAPVGLRFEGSYHELSVDGDLDDLFSSGNARVIAGTANVVFGFRIFRVHPYFIGGVGAYDVRLSGRSLSTGDAFSDSSTRFGWNAGAGVALPLGAWTGRIFVEARYTSIALDADRFRDSVRSGGRRFTFVPVSVGIVF